MAASSEGHIDVVKLLLEWEADVDAAAKKGVTALMLAAGSGHTEIVRLLLEWDAAFNVFYACYFGISQAHQPLASSPQ